MRLWHCCLFLFGAATTVSEATARQMLQSLLKQRFGLEFHRETRTSATYELVVAKAGPKLEAIKPDAKPGYSYEGKFWGELHGESTTTKQLAAFLSDHLERPVTDKTGIDTRFAVKLVFRIKDDDVSHPTLFDAL